MGLYRSMLKQLFHDPPRGVPGEAIKAVVFDCDGVLFDSKDANVRFYTHVLEQVGRPPVTSDQHEFIHMHPVQVSLGYLLGSGEAFQAAWAYCQTIDFAAFNTYLAQEPGLVELLRGLKESHRVAMATNRTVSTRQVLAHFGLDRYFDLVVSASDVENPKPHPDCMHKILDAFELSPSQVLYVGDSSVDEELAITTGVFFAAYKNPALRAHIHLDHFRDLHPVLGIRNPL
jgi:HAD superfamily hydrolase (TIGR01509 family)